MGYLRADLPVGHPDFGRLQVCDCRHGQVSQQVRQRLFELSHLDELSHLTFENFEPRGHVGLLPRQADSARIAYNQAQQFAQHLEGWLVLQGGYGCGKTHLAAAIANFAVGMGVPTLFITVPDLLDTPALRLQRPGSHLRGALRADPPAPLLVLDDFGTQNATRLGAGKAVPDHQLPLYQPPAAGGDDQPERCVISRSASARACRTRSWSPACASWRPITATPPGILATRRLSSLDLLHNRTFASFELRKNEKLEADELRSLEKASQAAREFAENPHGWLVHHGLLCRRQDAPGRRHRPYYRSELAIHPCSWRARACSTTCAPPSTPTATSRWTAASRRCARRPLLILDDLGTQSSSPWVKEKLYQLFNYRYNAELPTVITTAESLEEMDPRLRSRMLDKRLCQIYAITAPSYTGAAPSKSKPATRRTIAK